MHSGYKSRQVSRHGELDWRNDLYPPTAAHRVAKIEGGVPGIRRGAMGFAQFEVLSGRHERRWAPVSVLIEGKTIDPSQAYEVIDAVGMKHPAQVEAADGGTRVSWIVPRLAAGSTGAYTLEEAAEPSAGVELTDRPGEQVDIKVLGEPFTAYHYRATDPRPYLYPVLGFDGISVTRHFPMRDDIEGEQHDHKHHRSIWFTHGDVNGTDNWSESEKGHGKTRHVSFDQVASGPVYGLLQSRNRWVTVDEAPIVDQALDLRVYALPKRVRLVEATLRFDASHGDVVFGDTKEGGLLAVRVASSMIAAGPGTIEQSSGAIGEAESWGQPASWCHYTGPIQTPSGPATVGIGILDHPLNPRYPTHWHVRNYGLMTANPFGHSDFYKGMNRDGSMKVAAGESVTFRYRLVIHEGDASEGNMAGHFANFAAPVVAKLIEG